MGISQSAYEAASAKTNKSNHGSTKATKTRKANQVKANQVMKMK
jgi:hypothetical protein